MCRNLYYSFVASRDYIVCAVVFLTLIERCVIVW